MLSGGGNAMKRTTGRARATSSGKAPARKGPAAGFRAKVRMYRQGLGDCHLIRLPRSDDPSRDYFIMIDCGVVLGTPDAQQTMSTVVTDIMQTTGGRVDLLLATHE